MARSYHIFTSFLLVAVILGNLPLYTTARSFNAMSGRKVVLMSMDGFRHDYLTKGKTPNFDSLIASGVRVPYVNNTVVSLTFPSHYSIATGLYEESHGIIANAMYDPVLKKNFSMTSTGTEWWDEGEPIWINAVKSGRKTGVYFWPGSETRLEDIHPTQYRRYLTDVYYKDRVDALVDSWLTREDFDFGMIYFDEPDHSGHIYGPEAPEMTAVIERMDGILGYFIHKLEEQNLKDKVDFILTSDHGMTTIDMANKVIVLSDHVNNTLLKEVIGGGAVANLIPTDGKAKELKDALSGIEHITVYLKAEIPESYHYKNNRRVMPVVIFADEGWTVLKEKPKWSEKGNHGYTLDHQDMKPLLIASGPSFKVGDVVDPIKSVDIYPLLCHLLSITPAPNNGSFERAQTLLRKSTYNDSLSSIRSVYSTTLALITSLVTIFFLQ